MHRMFCLLGVEEASKNPKANKTIGWKLRWDW